MGSGALAEGGMLDGAAGCVPAVLEAGVDGEAGLTGSVPEPGVIWVFTSDIGAGACGVGASGIGAGVDWA